MVLYAFDIDSIKPGDILLTRVDFALRRPATWTSTLVQRATKSQFSHAALCIGYGMFIEAIGTGVCRLAIMVAGVHEKENVRLLRLKEATVPDAARRARDASAKGEQYLLRQYSRKGAAGVKLAALRDPDLG